MSSATSYPFGFGYRLLAVEPETVWIKPKEAKKIEGYVLKFITFVLGRPAGVEPFDPDKQGSDFGELSRVGDRGRALASSTRLSSPKPVEPESGNDIPETNTTRGTPSES